MFKKILIANRGEIALRIVRACREMGIRSVAVYSTADRDALHVRFADEAVCIGPPPGRDSYLNIPRLIAAAEITNAEAVHPGYGFLAENASFAEICTSSNLTFIGPTPAMITSMGDKASAKDTMRAAGVPVVPGSDGLLDSVEAAHAAAEIAGYPVILKATAGGGGKGMRVVTAPDEMAKAFQAAGTEAQASFSNGGVYLEKFVEEPRHVEIQVMGDRNGRVVALGERDCSVQRRHQKLIEESPSPAVDPDLRRRMGEAAVKGAEAVNYVGAGTIEFLLDKHGKFYFMEMNTRIQVEHPVTEAVLGIDLIKDQIRAAAGVELSDPVRQALADPAGLKPRGHAIEVRINAEDPKKDFRPSPGLITTLNLPGGPGVRVDTHVYAGYRIPPNYDSLIAKLIVHGATRDEAIDRMERALDEFIIEGIETTISFHRAVMKDPIFRSGRFTTKFLESFDFSKIR